ncbi:hypothetical protein HPB52_020033 [Rhipicephalus sanguineus]|uniref:RING-type domain-containing protein n=1 Tax=Rhipicephalus sanguineus TaxID=34632 RepID=A0A9D4YQL6_RHISA|nr:hypothetical protein HPB52_020033 [Rhipicephalus sanguineus]
MTPNVLHFKGFNDVLEGRPVQPVGEDLPVGMLDCSLCSVVSSEHYTLGCKHTYCVACFVGIVKKQHTATSLQCPVDGKCFRPRKALPKSTTDPELVRGLLVRCWNNDNGCGYTGTLEDMPAHFRGCVFYRLTCSVCSTSLLRPELASHVEKSHAKRRSKQHDVAVGSSDDPALKKRNSAEFPEDSKNVEFPERFASGDCFRQLAETTANQAASKTADRIKEHNEAFLLEVLSGLELIKDRIFSVAEAININFPPRSVANEDAFHPKSVVRAPEEIQHTEYTWVLEHYSKYRVGVHYIESPLFVMAPGYKVQLKVCIDGIASVQISVSLKIRRGDDERSLRLCWPFQRMCKFRLLDSSENSGDVARLFTPTQLFRSADDATSPSSGSDLHASGWLDIATIDRTVFERDYVTGDAFSISFTTMSPLD